MAAYPRFTQWRREVIRAAKVNGAQDMDFERLTALLGLLQTNRVERGSSPYDGSRPWLENAENENVRSSFHAIVAGVNPRHRDFVILGNMADAILHPKWACTRNHTCARQPGTMAACVRSMLRLARTVIFIDPSFHPGAPRYQSTIREFLDTAIRSRLHPPSRIEIHSSFSRNPGNEYLAVFQREMPALTPAGATVSLRRWLQRSGGEKLHDRFILTNLGGVTFTVGLDEGDHGETTAIHMLDRSEYSLRWSQYMGATPAFDAPLTDPPTNIVGTRPV